ncbi:MAG: bifunctional riboflavin kinase/FAD synthetase [Candidatus Poribacteria bacterium]|nr:bifunctional riboflavin kinase/FAD synthetase [Candidatus Poribacteria bacterium]
MEIFYNLEAASKFCHASVATVGVFDGLHIGHQAVIKQVLSQAEKSELPSLVLAFHPPPLAFLAPEKCPPTLTVISKRIEILERLGVDTVIFARFDANLQKMSPDQFAQQVLLEQLHAKQVVIGYEWQFGKGRTGNVEDLKQLGTQYEFGVVVVGPTEFHGLPVHSTRVREAIAAGKLDLAEQLLGRQHSILGKVITGTGLGRKLGFPTANIDAGDQMRPPNGVYAIQAKLGNRMYDGVLNMGTRPTFDGLKFQIESHLFGVDGMFYDKDMEIFFVEKIRDERTFPNQSALVHQIQQDIVTAQTILKQREN